MSLSGKLFSAIAPVAAGVSAANSEMLRAAECSSLQQNEAPQREICKTNPKLKPAMLSPRQQMAAVLLLRGRSISATARELGINRATVARWKKSPVFAAEIRQRVETAAKPPAIRQAPQVKTGPSVRELMVRKYRMPLQAFRVVDPPATAKPGMSQNVAGCSSLQQRTEKLRNEPNSGSGGS